MDVLKIFAGRYHEAWVVPLEAWMVPFEAWVVRTICGLGGANWGLGYTISGLGGTIEGLGGLGGCLSMVIYVAIYNILWIWSFMCYVICSTFTNPLIIYRKPKVGTEWYASVRASQSGVPWCRLAALVVYEIISLKYCMVLMLYHITPYCTVLFYVML